MCKAPGRVQQRTSESSSQTLNVFETVSNPCFTFKKKKKKILDKYTFRNRHGTPITNETGGDNLLTVKKPHIKIEVDLLSRPPERGSDTQWTE